jgi:glycogen operon protein
VDWEEADTALFAFAKRIIALRQEHPCLRQPGFLHGETREADGLPDVAWQAFDGTAVAWRDPGLARFCLILRGSAEAADYDATEDALLIAFNGQQSDGAVVLPKAPKGQAWTRLLDTAAPEAVPARCKPSDPNPVSGESLVVFGLGAAS